MVVRHDVGSLFPLRVAKALDLLTTNRTNESENPAIKAIKLGWKETTVASTITPKVGPQLASNLAAFHDPLVDRNFIIYQDKKALHIVDGGGQEGKGKSNPELVRHN